MQAIAHQDSARFTRLESYGQALCSSLYPVEVKAQGRRAAFAGSLETGRVGDLVLINAVSNTPIACRSSGSTGGGIGRLLMKYQVSGHCLYRHMNRTAHSLPGSIVALDADEAIDSEQQSSARVLIASLPLAIFDSQFPWVRNQAGTMLSADAGAAVVIGHLLLYIWEVRRATTSELADTLSAALCRLIGSSFAPSGEMLRQAAHARRLEQVRQAIVGAIDRDDLSPAWLGNRLGISRSSLYLITEAAGTTPERLIFETRLQVARSRLKDPSWSLASITSIALSVGFQNGAHFSRRFRALYDETPSAYRWSRIDRAALLSVRRYN